MSRRRKDGTFRKGGAWWIDYTDAEGRRHRKKVAPTHELAKLIYKDTVTAIAKGEVLGVREEGLRVKDFIAGKYWPTIGPGLSTWERQRANATITRQIVPRFGGTPLGRLQREDIERWQAERRAQVAGATANKELMRLKHCLNRAVEWGYLKASPAANVKKVTESSGRVRYLTPEEHEALLANASPALRPYVVAALQTGARRGELLALRWCDVDLRAQTLTFPLTKNGDTRSVPITSAMLEVLRAQPRPLDPNARVLPAWSAPHLTVAFGRLVRTLGIPGLRFHDLRHDAASTLTMAGVSQRAIMAILGHRDPRMTVRYQHLAPEHLREAMDALAQPRNVRRPEHENAVLQRHHYGTGDPAPGRSAS